MSNRFRYIHSCDLETNLQIKVGTLEGERDQPCYREILNDPLLSYSGACYSGHSDLYVTCQIYSNNEAMSLPSQTSYKSFDQRWSWNEWLILPLRFCDLPRNSILGFTIYDYGGSGEPVLFGSTTISLFGKYGTFRQGIHDLRIWRKESPDYNTPSSTPGKLEKSQSEMSRLSKLAKKHRNGEIPGIDWLDRLTFREIEMINEREKRESRTMYLMVEFPKILHENNLYTVVYFEKNGDEVINIPLQAGLVILPDPEIGMENLVESKHHRLARSLRSGPVDRDLKPNASTRDQLNTIMSYPPTKHLTPEEKDLLWKFRFYLSSQKQALAKFLKSVNWQLQDEVDQAINLLKQWSPMDIEDSLELLTPAFSHPLVRRYAVLRLREATDEDLHLYLMQLVQALKYENVEHIQAGLIETTRPRSTTKPEALSTQTVIDEASTERDSGDLIDNACRPPDTERQESDIFSRDTADTTPNQPDKEQSMIRDRRSSIDIITPRASIVSVENLEDEMDLATFLVHRGCDNLKLGISLYWYLVVECDDYVASSIRKRTPHDEKNRKIYDTVRKRFSQRLIKGGKELCQKRSQIIAMRHFIDELVNIVEVVEKTKGNRQDKIQKLQLLLAAGSTHQPQLPVQIHPFNFQAFDPIPLLLDPDILITGIDASKATLFKSALMPCRLTFRTTHDQQDYVTIFKHGDDLRQDQLVLQIITLMDKLLSKENLDLKLTPYKVLSISPKHGFVQFIDSIALADLRKSEDAGSILNYLRRVAGNPQGPNGIQAEVMDNYKRSCAGYCVITYILGVGDRHLDNLLLTNDGRLFHIDFGFILGRDPKPLPPAIKITHQMVEVMGGKDSEHFHQFKTFSYTAFLHLRRYANLFLNLFSLMVDADIPDIALEPDKAVKKVLDRFHLNLSDEEAVRYMQTLIEDSVYSKMSRIIDVTHNWAQDSKN